MLCGHVLSLTLGIYLDKLGYKVISRGLNCNLNCPLGYSADVASISSGCKK